MFKDKFLNYFGHMGLQKRLMTYFIIISIIPIIIISGISVYYTLRSTKEYAVEFGDSTITHIKTRVEYLIESDPFMSYTILLNEIEFILLDSFGDLGQVIIIDEKNTIVASSNNLYKKNSRTVQNAIALSEYNGNSVTKSFQSNNFIISRPFSINDWKIIGIIPWTHIYQNSSYYFLTLALIVSLIYLLTFYISKLITSTITKPIDNMIDAMMEVEKGNLEVKTEIDYDDELGDLGRNFNNMTIELSSMKDRVIEEQQKLRKSEFKALQSQINPHFLYNTLDSVVWLARMKKHEEIVQVVNSMTKLFRISLSRGKDIIPIEDEIDHVRSYLMIQKHRYRTHFDYDINVSEELFEYATPKLILQPLVENAIYHGVKLKRDGGKISITGELLDDKILFKVTDTGLGMTPETLEAIHYSFETNTNKISMYGIKNVHDRIKIFFGKDYGLYFESELGQGTTATITIPKYRSDDHVTYSHN